jgi:hypothetical protein
MNRWLLNMNNAKVNSKRLEKNVFSSSNVFTHWQEKKWPVFEVCYTSIFKKKRRKTTNAAVINDDDDDD